MPRIFNVFDFGAVGDNKTNDTLAVQRAIDECASQGGGRVVIEKGRFIIGTIYLRTNVCLYLEHDGCLVASVNPEDYPELDTHEIRKEYIPRGNTKSLIYAYKETGVSICGKGKIDGQGEKFCFPQTAPNANFIRKSDVTSPARVVFLSNCTDVEISGITMIDPFAGWSFLLYNCRFVNFTRVKINSNSYLMNTDGLHLMSCHDVVVSDCFFKTGDDGIVLRALGPLSEKLVPCERITVSNCIIYSHCSGIRIGWQGCTEICDAVFSNLVIKNTHTGIGIVFPYVADRPLEIYTQTTHIHDLQFSNIIFDGILYKPIDICVFEEEAARGLIDNISFSDIKSSSSLYPRFSGSNNMLLKNISINNSSFSICKNSELESEYPDDIVDKYLNRKEEYQMFKHVENFSFNNVKFTNV